ncbi:hypothetical protein [Amycolatopsis sp. NPDC051903]|uniref:hypothetical protein n=1 Tax=Amycolatopsis sp. NPDC051903 TaxID=3363936 RepID=UPI0037AC0B63
MTTRQLHDATARRTSGGPFAFRLVCPLILDWRGEPKVAQGQLRDLCGRTLFAVVDIAPATAGGMALASLPEIECSLWRNA